MTLSEIAAKIRASADAVSSERLMTQNERIAIGGSIAAVELFEADPDFKLRERIELVLREMEHPSEIDVGIHAAAIEYYAREVRNALNPNP